MAGSYYMAPGIANPLPSWASSDFGPGSVRATLTWMPDGTVTYTKLNEGVGPEDTYVGWYNPTTTGIGSSYWIKFVATTGTFSGLTSGTIYALSSQRAIYKAAVNAIASVTFSVFIYSDSGGVTQVGSVTGCTLDVDGT